MPADFLDTNVLVYAFSADPRAEAAQALLAKKCIISVQGLNEFTNVARRKMGMSWTEVGAALEDIRTLCPVVRPIDLDTHISALQIAERYGYSFYDALVVAAALQAGCGVLWSEDLQDGVVINSRLHIRNPFRTA